jgi:isopenicillin-N epimerase
LVQQPLPVPIGSPDEIAEMIWRGVTAKTRLLFISHITSPTAFHLPVEILCQRARDSEIMTLIDGAHAPGQIPFNLADLGADFYVGNCHKWMLSPKGAGFLYSRRGVQHLVDPLVVSWGWGENSPYTSGSRYIDNLEWWGTMDPSPYLAVPAAIDFQAEHNWSTVQGNCQQILENAVQRINELTGLDSAYSLQSASFKQMAVVPLPGMVDLPAFQEQLYQEYKIEVPCIQWEEVQLMRISVQAYNTRGEIDTLVEALGELIPRHRLT